MSGHPKRSFLRTRKKQHAVALEHVRALHQAQQKYLYSDRWLSQRYSLNIRRIGMKFRLCLPREIKHSYCKHCKTVFAPSRNCRVRLRKGMVVYYCFNCKKYTRLPFSKR